MANIFYKPKLNLRQFNLHKTLGELLFETDGVSNYVYYIL
jgi:hypothetical protein